jgi:hypothetical protein
MWREEDARTGTNVYVRLQQGVMKSIVTQRREWSEIGDKFH